MSSLKLFHLTLQPYIRYLWLILGLSIPTLGYSHHVLGRPSYSLNEDSNTPPSMQVETQIGKYFITYMVFPAFPKPNETGRVNLYIRKIADGTPFQGKVGFSILDDNLFSSNRENIGTQLNDDNVYRQGFIVKEEGNYLIRASFQADNEPYTIDFPLKIGSPWPVGMLSITLLLFLGFLIIINVLIRKKVKRLQAIQHQQEIR